MKKILFITLLLTFSLPIFSFSDAYKEMNENEKYLLFFSSLKGGEGDKEELLFSYLESERLVSAKVRAYYQMARYYYEEGNKSKGDFFYKRAVSLFDKIPESEEGIIKDLAYSDIKALEYIAAGGIKRGLDTSSVVKENYKKYPFDITVALCEAYRYLNTPAIAGGSVKKAKAILEEIKKEEDTLSPPDLFSFYIAYAISLEKSGEYDESEEYIKRALTIYSYDSMIETLFKDIRKGRSRASS